MQIHITVDSTRLPWFHELLAAGFRISIAVGSASIREILIGQIGLDELYLEDKIQTVFLNGRAVDDFDTTKISDGDVLALSAAMPGLVGAVLRRQSPFSTMRGFEQGYINQPEHEASEGWIILKLFNRVAADLGPDFLAAGIRIEAGRTARFLKSKKDLWYERIRVNGNTSEVDALITRLMSVSEVQLFVNPV